MTKRDRIVILVVASFVGLAAFYMLALKPKRDEAAKLGKDLQKTEKRVETAKADVAASEAARSSYAANYATVARLGKAVPTDDDVPSLVYQLDSTAQSTGVDFRSVKLTSGGGTAAQAPQNAATGAAATSDQANKKAGADEKKDDASTPTSAAAAPPTQAATAALPPGAVVGQAGLVTMPFSFNFEGSFFRLSDFLTRIERYIKPKRAGVEVQGRLLLLNGISLTAAQGGFPAMKASIAATAYLLPPAQGLFGGATPQGPAPSGGGNGSSSTPVNTGSTGVAAPATVTP